MQGWHSHVETSDRFNVYRTFCTIHDERERERDRDRETETDRDRQRQTETDRDRQRQTETETERQRDRETDDFFDFLHPTYLPDASVKARPVGGAVSTIT